MKCDTAAKPDRATAAWAETAMLHWRDSHLAGIGHGSANTIPAIAPSTLGRIAGLDLWDMWPVERADGEIVRFGESTLWLALAAPALPDPEDRHAIARIHLAEHRNGAWTTHGPAFPDGFTPGSREWSGSAVFVPGTNRLTIYFTAAGRRDETSVSFEQRLFEATATLHHESGSFRLDDWSALRESIVADGDWYLQTRGSTGQAGTIKAFRDPGFFRDPADGREYLLFAGSCAQSRSPWNGVIGIAERTSSAQWTLLPPVVSADGLNNELERPHIRCFGGLYYLFWSTQGKVFANGGAKGPTGLYGAVAPAPTGPFQLLNGTGLVATNPSDAPAQAYSWWVLADLSVNGFADLPGVADPGAVAAAAPRRAAFGGCPAPFFRIGLKGSDAWVEREAI